MFFEENGIKRHISSPRTLEQNAIAERRNKLVAEVARAMLFENDVSKKFCRQEVNKEVFKSDGDTNLQEGGR